VEDMGIDGRII